MKLDVFNILDCEALPNQYLHLTLSAPQTKVAAGHYFIIEDTYPCYIMGHTQDKIEFLVEPQALALISSQKSIHLSTLKGEALPGPYKDQFTLLIVEPGALSACLFYLKTFRSRFKGFVLIGTQDNFPFLPCPARQLVYGISPDIIAAVPLLEDWSIPNRLASLKEMPGVYHGAVESLAKMWLKHTSLKDITQLTIPALAAL